MTTKEREELLDTWVNGNRKDFVNALTSASPADAALLALDFAEYWSQDSDKSFQLGTLGRMLESRGGGQ